MIPRWVRSADGRGAAELNSQHSSNSIWAFARGPCEHQFGNPKLLFTTDGAGLHPGALAKVWGQGTSLTGQTVVTGTGGHIAQHPRVFRDRILLGNWPRIQATLSLTDQPPLDTLAARFLESLEGHGLGNWAWLLRSSELLLTGV